MIKKLKLKKKIQDDYNINSSIKTQKINKLIEEDLHYRFKKKTLGLQSVLNKDTHNFIDKIFVGFSVDEIKNNQKSGSNSLVTFVSSKTTSTASKKSQNNIEHWNCNDDLISRYYKELRNSLKSIYYFLSNFYLIFYNISFLIYFFALIFKKFLCLLH